MLDEPVELIVAADVQLIECLDVQLIEHPEIFAVDCAAEYLLNLLVQA